MADFDNDDYMDQGLLGAEGSFQPKFTTSTNNQVSQYQKEKIKQIEIRYSSPVQERKKLLQLPGQQNIQGGGGVQQHMGHTHTNSQQFLNYQSNAQRQNLGTSHSNRSFGQGDSGTNTPNIIQSKQGPMLPLKYPVNNQLVTPSNNGGGGITQSTTYRSPARSYVKPTPQQSQNNLTQTQKKIIMQQINQTNSVQQSQIQNQIINQYISNSELHTTQPQSQMSSHQPQTTATGGRPPMKSLINPRSKVQIDSNPSVFNDAHMINAQQFQNSHIQQLSTANSSQQQMAKYTISPTAAQIVQNQASGLKQNNLQLNNQVQQSKISGQATSALMQRKIQFKSRSPAQTKSLLPQIDQKNLPQQTQQENNTNYLAQNSKQITSMQSAQNLNIDQSKKPILPTSTGTKKSSLLGSPLVVNAGALVHQKQKVQVISSQNINVRNGSVGSNYQPQHQRQNSSSSANGQQMPQMQFANQVNQMRKTQFNNNSNNFSSLSTQNENNQSNTTIATPGTSNMTIKKSLLPPKPSTQESTSQQRTTNTQKSLVPNNSEKGLPQIPLSQGGSTTMGTSQRLSKIAGQVQNGNNSRPFDFNFVKVLIKKSSTQETVKEVMLDKKWVSDTIPHFANVIKGVSNNEGIEITMNCNPDAFEWIIKNLKIKDKQYQDDFDEEEHEKETQEHMKSLTKENCLNILVTSSFLMLSDLYDEIWDEFFSKNIVDIISCCKVSLSNLSPAILEDIAKRIDHHIIDQIPERKDKFISNVFRQKVENLVESEVAYKCELCNKVVSHKNLYKLSCQYQPQEDIEYEKDERCYIDHQGSMCRFHMVDTNKKIDLKSFAKYIREKYRLCQSEIYLRMWGLLNEADFCPTCNNWFPLNEAGNCRSHKLGSTKQPLTTQRRYMCCASLEETVHGCNFEFQQGCDYNFHQFTNSSKITQEQAKKYWLVINDIPQSNVQTLQDSGKIGLEMFAQPLSLNFEKKISGLMVEFEQDQPDKAYIILQSNDKENIISQQKKGKSNPSSKKSQQQLQDQLQTETIEEQMDDVIYETSKPAVKEVKKIGKNSKIKRFIQEQAENELDERIENQENSAQEKQQPVRYTLDPESNKPGLSSASRKSLLKEDTQYEKDLQMRKDAVFYNDRESQAYLKDLLKKQREQEMTLDNVKLRKLIQQHNKTNNQPHLNKNLGPSSDRFIINDISQLCHKGGGTEASNQRQQRNNSSGGGLKDIQKINRNQLTRSPVGPVQLGTAQRYASPIIKVSSDKLQRQKSPKM